ncbi:MULTISPECIES: Fe-S cluster assembly sulfur transfer protein SufU [Dietzia]|uniref:SUF system NifU family Fe-S cluster assembly protein n=1 Tax=Dietzia maris TaxID=37915 RepID=A0ABT8GWX5_9ACTN|nr:MULTISPECIES: SUF system NifU family Fe-S cluster assembly protein [Dietzia]MBB0990743.1 SUF system NifU family Fe-S cluster assembly protein [Dietzia sp. SLG510A3-30A2]MBB0993104.1 SUF system NifU family Fe-S cluster assembly protein [Dietzia sp. SLG510A3-40A3]MBB1010552.1 SUF system NifU family Fe-S cluster assembly protein [Dietzia sp. SLG510A3-3B2-2]MBB1018064.1 SUF system NifU family Fe-S cluster assembly protein [Dietzia sp. DQ11-71]MVZ89483.1 SUF system NifU family Fe-S cluster assem
MKLEQMYQEVILDHYRRPQHSGLREPFGAEVHHVNPTCGDELTLRLRLSDDLATVEDVSYDAQGCSISQASTSMMAELLVGRPVAESLEVVDAFQAMISSRGQDEGDEEILDDAVALAGVSRYPARVKCALLGWMAFKDALGRQTEHHQE